MGSRNVEGVGGVLGLKAATPIYQVVNYQKELKERVIGVDDFAKAKQLINLPKTDDAIYQQAYLPMKIAIQKLIKPCAVAFSKATGVGADELYDWKFKISPGQDKLEYKIKMYSPGAKKAETTLTVRIGTGTIDGKKQWVIRVLTPQGKWESVTKDSSIQIDQSQVFDWLGMK